MKKIVYLFLILILLLSNFSYVFASYTIPANVRATTEKKDGETVYIVTEGELKGRKGTLMWDNYSYIPSSGGKTTIYVPNGSLIGLDNQYFYTPDGSSIRTADGLITKSRGSLMQDNGKYPLQTQNTLYQTETPGTFSVTPPAATPAPAAQATQLAPQKNVDCGKNLKVGNECYISLAPITDPGGGPVDTSNFPKYLNSLYRIGIGACFVLGVIMFTSAGIQYIVSESMGGKSDAKSKINNALVGLAIALVSYIILNTINPDLIKLQNLNIDSPTAPAGTIPVTKTN